jgi:serine phosphatase RsbU (regulator of sigma subunit)/Flp pilus assembly protein TadD
MRNILKNLKYIIVLVLLSNTVISQTNITSLKNTLSNIEEPEKAISLIKIAEIYLESDEYYNIDSSIKYSNLALNLSQKINNDYYNAQALKILGNAMYHQQSFDSSLVYLRKAAELTPSDSLELKAEIYSTIATNYYFLGDYENTLNYLKEQLNINYKLNNKEGIALCLNRLGIIYKNMDRYEESIYLYQEALKIEEELGDSSNIARALNNIGNIYFHNRRNFNQAFNYYSRALEIYQLKGPKENEADLLNNIGLIYYNQKKYQNALNHFNEALKIYKELKIEDGIAKTQNLLAVLYAKLGNFEKAEENIQRSYNYYTSNNTKPRIAETLKDQGDIYLEWGKYQKALNAYYESYELSVELGRKGDIVSIYYKLSDTYAKLDNYQKAYEYHKQYSELNDSLFSEKVNRQIAEFQTLYETEKKDKEISLLNKDKALQDATLKRQKLVIWFFTIGFGIISILLILILRLFRQKQKANRILEQKNEEISLQRDHIFQQNKEITASIEYASRIQTALLPPQELIDKIIPDSFVLFKPRDIVSGDFYWLSQKENKIISVTADCTGHGVPGAFMSMLGISFLNEIVNLTNVDDLTADVILNDMRSLVISSLRQTGNIGESRDGMDLTLCIIDYDTMELNYSGAYNPLFIIGDGELIETKADKMPIGIHLKKIENFTNHIIPIKKGDLIYTFSDGYVDQFGGPDNSKFRKKNFIQLLLEIHQEDMPKQKEILEQKLQEWMEGYEQVDDILVNGIRI